MTSFQSRGGWGEIFDFLLLVLVVTAPLDLLLLSVGHLEVGRGFPIHSVMWAPAVAALLTCSFYRRDLASLGLSRFRGREVLSGYAVVLCYSLIAFALLWVTSLAPLNWQGFVAASTKLYGPIAGAPLLTIVFTLTFGVVQSGASALGEEIGWRGFLTPALQSRLEAKSAFLVGGLIWAAWHFPLIIGAGYSSDTPILFQLSCFTIMIISTGTMYSLLRLRSNSVWPAVVMHAAHNALIQWLLDPMTQETGRGAWFAGEFGAGLAAMTAIFALAMVWHAKIRGDSPFEAREVSHA